MNEERRYLAMHGLTYEVSVEGDGDCKKAYFNKPINSYEEEWWALGVKEDAEAIANLAVNLRDELRSCIVERDRARAINNELLEALEFCCYRTTPGADCYCQHGQGLVKLGHCSEESYCHVWQTIQKEKGLQQ